jgi:DNA helicase-2/ATP-dependent DNA helicase PcrA
MRFFEQQHVKDVLAYLRLLVNPREETAFKRILKLLPKVGERTAATLWAAVGGNPDPVGSFLRLDMRKAPAGAQGPLKKLAATLESLRRPSLQAAPAEAIRFVVDEGGYADVAKSKFANHRARLDDLEALAQFALPYDGVESFLEEITLFGEPSGETVIAAEKDDERLVLSSIHQAKGLEWRAVFVIGLVEDRFPNVRAAKTAEGLEEERRLFYVAATRAKDELVLVHPLAVFDRYGIVVVTESSRFLRELPENLFERWVLEAGPPLPAVARANAPRLGDADDPTVEADEDEPVN